MCRRGSGVNKSVDLNDYVMGTKQIQHKAIIRQLDQLMDGGLKGVGLYEGKCGAAFACFTWAHLSGSDEYAQKGRELLSEVCNNLGSIDNGGFTSGLTGVGWGIEAMAQNQFIPVNTDAVLKDFDDFIYKSVTFQKSVSLSIDNGSLGRALYFYQRIKSPHSNLHPYQTIAHQECLILLVDEIKEHLLDEKRGVIRENTTLTEENARDVAQCLILLYDIYKTRIDTEISIQAVCKIKTFVEGYFRNSSSCHPYDLWLLNAYSLLASNTGDRQMSEYIREYFKANACKYSPENNSFLYRTLYQQWNQTVGGEPAIDPQAEDLSLFEILLALRDEKLNVPWQRCLLVM